MIETTLGIYTEPLRDLNGARRFRVDETGPNGIFCDSPGTQPDSVLFGIGLIPVVQCPGSNNRLIGPHCNFCGQKVGDRMTGTEGWWWVGAHETTPETIEAYNLDAQHGAIYFDATREQVEGLIAQLQRVIDDNWAESA